MIEREYRDIRTAKAQVRDQYREMREQLPASERAALDLKISEKFTDSVTFRHADTILLYASFGSEVDTCAIFDLAIQRGKRVAYPKCLEGRKMAFFYVQDRSVLQAGGFGIPEPPTSCEKWMPDARAHTVCIVPAIVYDREGYRIGYGKGYYDRFLTEYQGASAGLCYESHLLKGVPRGMYDKHVDMLFTEKRICVIGTK